MKYKFLSHTADIKVHAEGRTIEKAFINSVLALGEVIREKIIIKSIVKKKIVVEGKDFPSLLYNFLEEILFLLDAENFLFSKVKNLKIIKIANKLKLEANILGDGANTYKFSNDVKAITYNDMIIKENKNKKWIIEFVLDV